jgi:hypothetical protein
MKTRWVIFLALLILLFIGATVLTGLVKAVLPGKIRDAIQEAVAKNCPTCSVEIANIDFSIFHPSFIRFSGVKFSMHHPSDSAMTAEIEDLDFNLNLHTLRRDHLDIDLIVVHAPNLTFIDGDEHSPLSNPKKDDPSLINLAKIEIENGRFKYVRNTKGTSATLHLKDLNGDAFIVDAEKPKAEQFIGSRFTMRIENSGQTELKIKTPLENKTSHFDVEVDIKEQNLSDLTPFFIHNAGVELNGKMARGKSLVTIRGDELKASVWAEYHDLRVKVVKMYDRNSIEALFTNLGADLSINETDEDLIKEAQTRAVELKRKPGEPVIGFAFRGMKEAALKVAKVPRTRENSTKKSKASLQMRKSSGRDRKSS